MAEIVNPASQPSALRLPLSTRRSSMLFDAPSPFASPVPFATPDFKALFGATGMPTPGDTLNFEQDYCSNFTCCNRELPSFHSLLDHFEESHVVVFDAAGHPIYPPAAAQDVPPPLPELSQPSSPTSSSDGSYFSDIASPVPSHVSDDLLAQLERIVSSLSPPASPTLSTAATPAPLSAGPASPADICLPPSLLTLPPDLPPSPTGSLFDDVPGGRKTSEGPSRVGRPRAPYRRARDSEKGYRCPNESCSKRYLNPGGLKYHMERGTCTVDLAKMAKATPA